MISVIVQCKDEKEKKELMETFHSGLKGSPSYIDSEILLGDNSKHHSFVLIVGNENDNNLSININSNNLIININNEGKGINFKIDCGNDEKMIDLREKMYMGLVGSPGYVENEIILGETRNIPQLYLIVGTSGENGVLINIDSDNLIIK